MDVDSLVRAFFYYLYILYLRDPMDEAQIEKYHRWVDKWGKS